MNVAMESDWFISKFDLIILERCKLLDCQEHLERRRCCLETCEVIQMVSFGWNLVVGFRGRSSQSRFCLDPWTRWGCEDSGENGIGYMFNTLENLVSEKNSAFVCLFWIRFANTWILHSWTLCFIALIVFLDLLKLWQFSLCTHAPKKPDAGHIVHSIALIASYAAPLLPAYLTLRQRLIFLVYTFSLMLMACSFFIILKAANSSPIQECPEWVLCSPPALCIMHV